MNFLSAKNPATQANKSTEDDTKEEVRRIDHQFGKDNLREVLVSEEISLYNEFLEPSETRFSKTKIFTDYKEFHNRRNIIEVDRHMNKKFFVKQLRIVNKEKQIDKRIPCWASDVDLLRKV